MSTEHHGGYAPLPQSISNTDTEDEDEHLTLPNNIGHNHHEMSMPIMQEPRSMPGNGMYYPLDETRNINNFTGSGQNSLKYYRDDIPVLVIEENSNHNDLWKSRTMSPIRRFFLVLSILLCFLTIIGFLYILPCDSSMVCPPYNIEQKSSISWDETLQNVELHGPISIVPGSPYNLIFLLREQLYGTNYTNPKHQRRFPSEESGVLSMKGESGLFLWKALLHKLPTDIDCLSLDTDKSGKPDCIVVGEQGLLASIEPTEGTILWSSPVHTFNKLPIIIPDVDADGVNDLLSIDISVKTAPHLVLLSGAKGHLIQDFINYGNCSSINVYSLVTNGAVEYNCIDLNGTSIEKPVTLEQLLHGTNGSYTSRKMVQNMNNLPRTFKTKKNIDPDDNCQTNLKLTPYHFLSVTNKENCPGKTCAANINISALKANNQLISIWNETFSNAVASAPVPLGTVEQPYTAGFAIKIWQWNEPLSTGSKAISSVIERKLIEKVLIVVLNHTDAQVINASQSNITQLCQGEVCQPNLSRRNCFGSLAIVSLGNDGVPELISYSSSYTTGVKRSLLSKIQVVKLDSFIANFLHANV